VSNFLLVIDPDKARRTAIAARALGDVAFLPHLKSGSFENDSLSLVWAASPTAPVSQHSDRGTYCHVFGEPLDEAGRPTGASALASGCMRGITEPSRLDGFYAALFHDPVLGLRVEADVLGLFPIYYAQMGDVVLAGSSSALFALHPLFSRAVNPRGIAAVLLTSGLVGNDTLEARVRRLRPDHVLACAPGGEALERAPAPVGRFLAPNRVEEAVEEAAALHERFLRGSLLNSREPGLLLSGGLDSRLLAGFLTRMGHAPHCLTFGGPRDIDAQCAVQVADALGLAQSVDNVQVDAYPGYAENCVRWEGLSAGLYTIPMGWNLTSTPSDLGIDRIVSGLTLDAVVGGPKEVPTAGRSPTFEQLRVSTLGFGADELDRLVRSPELRRGCDEVRSAVVDQYMGSGHEDYIRTWRINLAARNRFPVGACAWRYSFYAWPILPALDRRLLRLAANLPQHVIGKRQVQKTMLGSQFPKLAALDLDRNYFDMEPLHRPATGVAHRWRRRLFKARCHARAFLGSDPRFYVRVMELNSPGWRQVRRLAERGRSSLAEFFNMDALARALPGPGARIRRKSDAIIHSTPLKNTLGLMSWMHQRA
jgi:asparagine synthase (glutamine-hydrolysing)